MRSSEGELPKSGAVNVPPTVEYGLAVSMVMSCQRQSSAQVGKRAQTNEGMGKRGHNMAHHYLWGKCRNGSQSSTCHGLFETSVGYRDAYSLGTWVAVGNGGAAREVEATGARAGNTPVLMRNG
jgi:hypothetical protein